MEEYKNNYKLIIAYDGTAYSGWQIQPHAQSIQQLIQGVIQQISQENVRLIGSGRTDAGVHALGQVAHFKTYRELDIDRLLISMNSLLPKDIRIISVEKIPLTFHAQRSAVSKTYYYHLCLERYQNPSIRFYSYHVRHRINLERLEAASQYFVGTHNFTSFTNQAHTGTAAYDPIRTISRIDIIPEPYGVHLEFQANGFLYKMVRNIMGTLLEVSEGKIESNEIPAILTATDRRKAGKAAEPHGLFLANVEY